MSLFFQTLGLLGLLLCIEDLSCRDGWGSSGLVWMISRVLRPNRMTFCRLAIDELVVVTLDMLVINFLFYFGVSCRCQI